MTGSRRSLAESIDQEVVAERMTRLSERERQVMALALAGRTNREIASCLGISPRTVEVFRARMMEKMQARGLAALIRMMTPPAVTS